MSSARVYRTEAVVLRGYDYGEADRILTLYTPGLGKVRAVAKGVRRTKSRMSGHVDLFTRSTLQMAHGRQLDIVTQADTIESFRPVRDDLWRLSYCQYVAEIVDGFTAEGLANSPLYTLLVHTLRRLAISAGMALVVRSFEVELLGLIGYRPQLHRCLHCSDEIQAVTNRFSARLGGILCPNCGAADSAAISIDVPALKVLRHLQKSGQDARDIAGVPENVQIEVEKRLQDYITYRLEHRPRSVAFLDRLRAEGA